MSYKYTDETQRDEHAVIGGVAGKKVFVVDNVGNQITTFSLATVSIANSQATVTVVNSLATITLNPPSLGANATYGNATITDVATQIIPADNTRRSLTIQNISLATIFIGTTSEVTINNGFELLQNTSLDLDQYEGAVFGIADATGHQVRFISILD